MPGTPVQCRHGTHKYWTKYMSQMAVGGRTRYFMFQDASIVADSRYGYTWATAPIKIL